jgi:glutathione S-transferase
MLTLYQEHFSHWCVKVRKILNFKQIEHDIRNVSYHDKRELIQTTGQDYVPAIVNDGKVITYADVPDFLEQMKPAPTIYPNGTRSLAKAIENWAHYRVEEIVWRYVVADFPKTFKDDLERWVFIELQEKARGPLEVMELRKPAFKIDMEAHLKIVNDLLKDQKFLLAETPSLGDFAMFGAIYPLRYSGNELPHELGNLRTWYESIDKM